MRKFLSLSLVLFMFVLVITGCAQTTSSSTPAASPAPAAKEESTRDLSYGAATAETQLTGKHHVVISIKDAGEIQLELDADAAPVTVSNFVALTKDGFYDGLTFHRIMDGFMMQGGDPLGNGTGGPDTNITGEFAANGIENPISHVRGVISMARAKHPDSAGSQFFIVHQDALFLDGNYAAFGIVTDGMDIVDAICAAAPVVDNNGTVLPDDQPIIDFIKVID